MTRLRRKLPKMIDPFGKFSQIFYLFFRSRKFYKPLLSYAAAHSVFRQLLMVARMTVQHTFFNTAPPPPQDPSYRGVYYSCVVCTVTLQSGCTNTFFSLPYIKRIIWTKQRIIEHTRSLLLFGFH